MTFTLHLTDGRTEPVTAEAYERRGSALVFITTQLVMGQPREVVLRRIPAVQVREVS
jgi:hypothetical protein